MSALPIISPQFESFISGGINTSEFTSNNNIAFVNTVTASLRKLYEMYTIFDLRNVKQETRFVLRQLADALMVALSPAGRPLYSNEGERRIQWNTFSRLMKNQQGCTIPGTGLSSVFHIQNGQSFKDNIFELTSAIEQMYEYVINGQNNGSAEKFINLLNAHPPTACLNDAISKILEIVLTPAIEDNMDAVSDLTEDICKMYKIAAEKGFAPWEKNFDGWVKQYFLNPRMFGFITLSGKYPELSERDFKYYLDKYVKQYVTQRPDGFNMECSMFGGKRRRVRKATNRRRRRQRTIKLRRY